MEQIRIERLDHLGLIASVIKDLGLIASKYSSNPSQEVSSGTPRHLSLGVIGQKAPAPLDVGSDPLGQATAERPPLAASGSRHGPSVCVWSE